MFKSRYVWSARDAVPTTVHFGVELQPAAQLAQNPAEKVSAEVLEVGRRIGVDLYQYLSSFASAVRTPSGEVSYPPRPLNFQMLSTMCNVPLHRVPGHTNAIQCARALAVAVQHQVPWRRAGLAQFHWLTLYFTFCSSACNMGSRVIAGQFLLLESRQRVPIWLPKPTHIQSLKAVGAAARGGLTVLIRM